MKLECGYGFRDGAKQLWRRNYVRYNTHHVAGPRRFKLGDGDVVLILLGRDVLYYMPKFFEHYKSLGVEHFVYMDNGSTDGSAEYAAQQPNTIVASCGLNFRDFQRELRFVATQEFADGGWRLVVDADELLDYLGAPHVSLPDLVSVLASGGYTGLVAQMLEMVPEEPIGVVAKLDFASAIPVFRNYSIRDITAFDYQDPNVPEHFFMDFNKVANPDVKILYGGIRRTLFSEECMLTKHVLFQAGADVLPMPHPHVTCGLYCADFTAVLRHYKFAGKYLEREQSRRAENRLSHNEGNLRLKALVAMEDAVLSVPGMRQNPTPEDLIEQGFLVASDKAKRTLLRHA